MWPFNKWFKKKKKQPFYFVEPTDPWHVPGKPPQALKTSNNSVNIQTEDKYTLALDKLANYHGILKHSQMLEPPLDKEKQHKQIYEALSHRPVKQTQDVQHKREKVREEQQSRIEDALLGAAVISSFSPTEEEPTFKAQTDTVYAGGGSTEETKTSYASGPSYSSSDSSSSFDSSSSSSSE